MRRACKVTLQYATERKRRSLVSLLQAYRAAVNFYIASLWQTPGRLDKLTLARLVDTRLSQRYKSQALKQALEVVVSTRKAAHATHQQASMPVFTGAAVLDGKFVSVEAGRGSFDLVVRLSSLCKGHRLTIPTRQTRTTNKWLSQPGAQWIQGCALREDSLVLWIEIPDSAPTAGQEVLGVDVGINKLIADSNGAFYGTEFRAVRDKIRRCQPGSRARERAIAERTNLINRAINQLPWSSLSVIGVERLHDLKRGKQKNRSKAFRKAVSPWTYRQVLTRIEHKAQENRVRLVAVDPANTSRECPACNKTSERNRRGETFKCIFCGYTEDADHVGAMNVRARTLRAIGSVESPMPPRTVI